MRTGRPLRWSLEGAPSGTFIDALQVAGGARIALPAEVRTGLGWLAAGRPVLSVLEDHGRVRLVDVGDARAVSARMTELSAGDQPEDSSLRLLAIQYRYRHVACWVTDGRLVLPLTVVAHLDAVSDPVIYIARIDESVELWSRARTEEQLLTLDSDRDLP